MADGNVPLVTGCSQGIGRDLAGRMTRAGYAVAATARRAETLDRLPLDVDGAPAAAIPVLARCMFGLKAEWPDSLWAQALRRAEPVRA